MAEVPPYPGTPRWVKIMGIAALGLILIFVIANVMGIGGPHGPGRHSPAGDSGGLPPSVLAQLMEAIS